MGSPGSSGYISTSPNTPDSFGNDVYSVDEGAIFAYLSPLNPLAREAFDALIDEIIRNPDFPQYRHARQFVKCGPRTQRAASVFSEDESGLDGKHNILQREGAFKISLMIPPNEPEKGWQLGSSLGREASTMIDLLLSPSSGRLKQKKIAAKHATLYIHPDSCRVMLQAYHSVILGGRKGAKTMAKGSPACVVDDGQIIIIGDCSYALSYNKDLYSGPRFRQQLTAFMKKYHTSHWTMNTLVADSVAYSPMALGQYCFSPGAFAQGTFGEVTAGWGVDGTSVAVKRFTKPDVGRLQSHKEIMTYIGTHVSVMTAMSVAGLIPDKTHVLSLVEIIENFETQIPSAFAVYLPLAIGNLYDVSDIYALSHIVQILLLGDFASGLAYLHDKKQVMHRDIKPGNLGVVSMNPLRGILLDLDSATCSVISDDHMEGTLPYLAPEIINWKRWDAKTIYGKPKPYDKAVDVWALGLSAFAILINQPHSWVRFKDPKRKSVPAINEEHWVDYPRYTDFRQRLQCKRLISDGDLKATTLLQFIEDMTEWEAEDRHSAGDIAKAIRDIGISASEIVITTRSGQKRRRDDE